MPTLNRREFLASCGAAGSLAPGSTRAPAFKVRTLTCGPAHHFFGYYGITPWNRSGRYLACLESDFQDHMPGPDEPARIGVVDARTGAFRAVGETRAWNFQQGAMMHWNPVRPESEILHNERRGDEIVSAAIDIETGRKRFLRRAINGVSRNGRHALCLTYGRLTRLRPVVGYAGARDPNPDDPHPDNDGVYVMNLATGEARLVVTIGEVYRRLVREHPFLRERHMWFNHTVFNTDATRFFFLARCWTDPPNRRLESAMFTAALDGSGLREVIPFGLGVSHFEWRNETEIMATFRHNGSAMKHVLFTDGKRDYQEVGSGFLSGDGHCSFAPDQIRIATDQYVGETLSKRLLVFNLETREGVELGSFPMRSGEFFGGDLRCDLHPRWDRTGAAICFDALETGSWTRQLHVASLARA
ncbi:MAG TPA: hypothetical protein VN428_11955 [Bryobacteraceae bacterium]|nr:hypothetical protein [Bryobacteraceae bacterium]